MNENNKSKVFAVRLKPDIVREVDEYKIENDYESDTEALLKIIRRGLEAIRGSK